MAPLPGDAPGNELSPVRLEEHLDYVRALAREIHRNLPSRVEFEELVQFGMVGLAEAAHAFDPGRGAAFRTFAFHRVRGAVFDGLAQVCRGAHAAFRRHIVQASALNTVAEREAADGPLRSRATQRVALVVLLSDLSGEQAPQPECRTTPEDEAQRQELRARVRKALALLPALECAVLRLHYFEGLTLTQCGLRLNRHKAWISRLHARGLDLLREHLSSLHASAAVRNSA